MPLSPRSLRVIGVTWLALALFDVVEVALRWQLTDAAWSGSGDTETLFARLRMLAMTGIVFHVAGVVTTLVLVGRTLTARIPGHLLRSAAAALLAAHVLTTLLSLYMWIAEDDLEIPDVLWVMSGIALYAAASLILLAAARAGTPSIAARVVPWALGAVAVAAVVVSRIADAAFDASRETHEPPPEALHWATIGLSFLWQLAFGLGCFFTTATVPSVDAGEGDRLAGSESAAGGLRHLAAAMIVRMVLGALASVGTGLALREGGRGLPLLTAFLDAMIAIWVIASLVRYRRLPPEARGEGSGLALAAVILSIPLGLVSGWAANELAALVARARGASSMWGMPSLSEIETLQGVLAFTTVVGLLAGIGGGLGLATSFRRTAERLGRDELTQQAGGLIRLIAAASLLIAVIVIPVLLQASMPVELLLALAVVALALGIFAAVQWVQVTLGLSRALSG